MDLDQEPAEAMLLVHPDLSNEKENVRFNYMRLYDSHMVTFHRAEIFSLERSNERFPVIWY